MREIDETKENVVKELYGELTELLEEMKKHDPSSDAYEDIHSMAVSLASTIAKLEERSNEIRIEELKQEGIAAELSNNLAVEEIKQSIPLTKVVLELTKVVLPMMAYIGVNVWGANKWEHFERSGFTSIMKSSDAIRRFMNDTFKMK